MIVEPVPSARLEQGYAAQVLVYDDETYMMQDVAEEQEVETENSETGRHRKGSLLPPTLIFFNKLPILCFKVFCLYVCLRVQCSRQLKEGVGSPETSYRWL